MLRIAARFKPQRAKDRESAFQTALEQIINRTWNKLQLQREHHKLHSSRGSETAYKGSRGKSRGKLCLLLLLLSLNSFLTPLGSSFSSIKHTRYFFSQYYQGAQRRWIHRVYKMSCASVGRKQAATTVWLSCLSGHRGESQSIWTLVGADSGRPVVSRHLAFHSHIPWKPHANLDVQSPAAETIWLPDSRKEIFLKDWTTSLQILHISTWLGLEKTLSPWSKEQPCTLGQHPAAVLSTQHL